MNPGMKLIRKIGKWCVFFRDYLAFRRRSDKSPRLPLHWRDRKPCLNERAGSAGFDRHYVLHVGWAARVLAEMRPRHHVDVSSSVYFSAVVSAFVPVRFYEYHPPTLGLEGLETGAADLLRLPFPDDSVESLSCMHVVEHIGLGRYGDPIDPDGDRKAMAELQRVLGPGGQLLLVVPVGRPRVEFNAHRVYGYDQVVNELRGLRLVEFALIPDDRGPRGRLIRNAPPELVKQQEYGCGCFRFVKVI